LLLLEAQGKLFRSNGREFRIRFISRLCEISTGDKNQLAKKMNLKEMEKHGQIFADLRRAAPTRKESNSNTRPLSGERQKLKTKLPRCAKSEKRAVGGERRERPKREREL